MTADRICTPVTQCALGTTFEAVPPTLTRDRNCSSVRECKVGVDFETSAPSVTADRICTPVTQCVPGTEEVVAPTADQDRQCANMSAYSPSDATGPSPSVLSSSVMPSLTPSGAMSNSSLSSDLNSSNRNGTTTPSSPSMLGQEFQLDSGAVRNPLQHRLSFSLLMFLLMLLLVP